MWPLSEPERPALKELAEAAAATLAGVDKRKRRKYDQLERDGLLPRMRQILLRFSVPLWWEINGRQALRNGSMIVVKTREALFGVTCRHVLNAYEYDKHTLPDLFCQLGSAPFDPSANVISLSKAWDLVTFRIPAETLTHIGAHRVLPVAEWPPAPLENGDRIMVGGYPENKRSQSPGSRPELLNIDLVTFISWASNASEHSVSFSLDSSTWYWPQGNSLEPQPKLSGASGGPCFRLMDKEPYFELAGFIYEGHIPYELVLIRQASLIAADGTIAAGPVVESLRSRQG